MKGEIESGIGVDGGRPIVMVDDNSVDLSIASACYKKAGLENEWLSFSRGTAFLDYMQAVQDGNCQPPLLLLLDVNMPPPNGFEVLEALSLRFSAVCPTICMFSGSTDPRDQARALRLGATYYQEKPSDLHAYVAFFAGLAGGTVGGG